MVAYPHDAKAERSSSDPLWSVFGIIQSYYYREDGSINHDDKHSTAVAVKCMFELLEQIPSEDYTSYEKVGIYAAKEYWLHDAKDLAPLMIQISNVLEARVTYNRPIVDNRYSCVMQVLSVDSDQFCDFPDFLEGMHYAGLSESAILQTVKKCFDFVPKVRALD